MAPRTRPRPLRSLVFLAVTIAVLFGTVAAGAAFGKAEWSPRLALDLEGGTEIILSPVASGSQRITDQNIREAVNIISQRVNGSGVSEAEVTTQAGRNIVVSLPGKNVDQRTRDLVKQSAQLRFRAVLVSQSAAPAVQTPSGAATSGTTPSSTATPSSTSPATSSPPPRRAVPRALLTGRGPADVEPPSAGGATGAAPATPSPSATPPGGAKPANASDLAWVTPEVARAFTALDCTRQQNRQGGGGDDPAKPLVTCNRDGTAKYILGPAEVEGTDVRDASAGLAQSSTGGTTNEWVVQLEFTGPGTTRFAAVTTRLASLTGVRNQFAIVLDGLVITDPTTNEPIPGGRAQISGSFTQASAQTLANQLKYGALPLSFVVQTEQQISALLGAEQLHRGLLAGIIGLLLVIVYSLLQYRALGLITVASLAVAGLITYGLVLLLGWVQGFRLSLPGVAGLIVSVGITADSFIVFFERVRDEVRDGRTLRAAVAAGWSRARRTVLASDSVSFLAALVLFILAVGGVRGFAYTLGLTTLVDVVVVSLFTYPAVTLIARTRFFAGGHRLSGFDPDHLGTSVRLHAARPGSGRPAAESGRPAGFASPAGRPRAGEAGAGAAASASARAGADDGAEDAGRPLTIAERKAAVRRSAGDSARSGSTSGAPAGAPVDPDTGATHESSSAGGREER